MLDLTQLETPVVMVISREFDTVGIFARDLKCLQTFVEATLDSPSKFKTVCQGSSTQPPFANNQQLPKEILYSTEFIPHGNSAGQGLIDKFVAILEKFLGVKRTNFTLADRWAADPPAEAKGKSLAEYAYKVCPAWFAPMNSLGNNRSSRPDTIHSTMISSMNLMHSAINTVKSSEPMPTFHPACNGDGMLGLQPISKIQFANNTVLRDRGEEISKEEVQQSLTELEVLRSWFAKAVLRADESSGSSAILILPVGPTEPNYRDAFIEPTPRLGIDALSLASFMKMPQLVVPSRFAVQWEERSY